MDREKAFTKNKNGWLDERDYFAGRGRTFFFVTGLTAVLNAGGV